MTQSQSDTILVPKSARRNFLGTTSRATLSAAAVLMLSGREALAQGTASNAASDAAILNVALGLEYQAIAAYTLGAQSGLLGKPALDLALYNQAHHKAHRDLLAATVTKLGGTPVAEKPLGEYATALNAGSIKTAGDIIDLALKLELGATNAYLGVIPSFKDAQLAKVSGRLAAEECSHYIALLGAAGKPLPLGPLSFGA